MANKMQVDVFEDAASMERLKDNWETVHAADPETHICQSWGWFSIMRENFDYNWLLLAAKPDKAVDYVAFCPLKLVTRTNGRGEYSTVIKMAARGEYTGFLSHPDHRDGAIRAFASYLQGRKWSEIDLEYVRNSETSLRPFLGAFSKNRYLTGKYQLFINNNTINNNICPFVTLPGDWDTYLAEKMSANTRQKARRFLKKIDEGKELRIAHATGQTFEAGIETLIRLWEITWGEQKGKRLARIINSTHKMLTALFRANMLVLPILWNGETPVSAIALVKDEKRRRLHFQIGGRDEIFNNPPPGFTLHAHSIRWAIQNGYSAYDFMRGNEAYKYMFGCEEFQSWNLSVRHKTKIDPGSQLDDKSLGDVLDRAKKRSISGKYAHAESGYRQVLAANPRNARAHYLLGKLLARQGKLDEAKELFKQLVTLRPRHIRGWLRYGNTLQSLGHVADAERCYRKVLELDPGNSRATESLVVTSA